MQPAAVDAHPAACTRPAAGEGAAEHGRRVKDEVEADIEEILRVLRQPHPRHGRLRLDEMISSRIQLEEINDAFDAMRKGEAARQVIMFE